MQICKRCVISGKVQGVCFRQSTLEQARRLAVTGWVRNLNNGDVECLLCGEDETIQKLIAWLRRGPKAAIVNQLIVQEHAWEIHEEFSISSDSQ